MRKFRKLRDWGKGWDKNTSMFITMYTHTFAFLCLVFYVYQILVYQVDMLDWGPVWSNTGGFQCSEIGRGSKYKKCRYCSAYGPIPGSPMIAYFINLSLYYQAKLCSNHDIIILLLTDFEQVTSISQLGFPRYGDENSPLHIVFFEYSIK